MKPLPFSPESVLNDLPYSFQAFDREWRCVYLNQRAELLLGKKREELLGKVFWEEYPEVVGAEFHQKCLEATRTGHTVVFESFSPQEKRWLEFSLHPYPDGLGVFTRDITEIKQAQEEAARHASVDALRQSEERFRILVEQVKDYAIFMLDPQGNIATWNEGAERFKGYKADEIIGQHFSRFYTPEDIARRHPWNELEIVKKEGRYEEEGWRLRKDGSRFWANVVITALRDENNELRGFAKVTRDMTERRAREQEQAATDLAEQQRRVLKEMLSSVTGGRLVLCDGTDELPEHLTPWVAAPDEMPVITLDKSALRYLRHRTMEAARQAEMDKGRVGKLVTAVNEAAMNAIVHAGGGTATVEVDRKNGVVQVWVEDQGPGIDMSRLPKATLDRGFTTAATLGHGFKLLLVTADRIWLLTRPTGTTVVIQHDRTEPIPDWLTEKETSQLSQSVVRIENDPSETSEEENH